MRLTDGHRERAERLLKGITPGEWFAANMPPNGWTIFWQQDAPIAHMRWADGLRPDVEARLEAEAEFIAAAPQLVRDLLAESTNKDYQLGKAAQAIIALKAELADARYIANTEAETANRLGAEVAALKAENDRLKALVTEWKEAYEGTDHAQMQREWQAERESGIAEYEDLRAKAASLSTLQRQIAELREEMRQIVEWDLFGSYSADRARIQRWIASLSPSSGSGKEQP